MIILRKQFSEGPHKSRELRFKDPDVRFRGREPEEGEEDEEMEDPVDEESEDTEPEFDEDMVSEDNLEEGEEL